MCFLIEIQWARALSFLHDKEKDSSLIVIIPAGGPTAEELAKIYATGDDS